MSLRLIASRPFKFRRVDNTLSAFDTRRIISVSKFEYVIANDSQGRQQNYSDQDHWRLGWSKVAGFCFALGVGISVWASDVKRWMQMKIPTVYAANLSDGGGSIRNTMNFIADVVEKAAPSVVSIELKMEIFGTRVTKSNGSGFIISPDGLILTSAHLFTDASSLIEVKLKDGRTFRGVVESIDTRSDLATVRITAQNLPVMKLGSSSTLRPGEFVIAIGSPYSLSNTVTAGVVSTVGRSNVELGLRTGVMEYIQTDAAITFGNSGGPLVNLDGEAIGINNNRITAGISFAIPIDYAKDFLQKNAYNSKKVKTSGNVNQRLYTGLSMVTLTKEILSELQNQYPEFSASHGVLICQVRDGSPGAFCGLRKRDVITHINGKPVSSPDMVYELLEKFKSGLCRVKREHHELDITIELG